MRFSLTCRLGAAVAGGRDCERERRAVTGVGKLLAFLVSGLDQSKALIGENQTSF